MNKTNQHYCLLSLKTGRRTKHSRKFMHEKSTILTGSGRKYLSSFQLLSVKRMCDLTVVLKRVNSTKSVNNVNIDQEWFEQMDYDLINEHFMI